DFDGRVNLYQSYVRCEAYFHYLRPVFIPSSQASVASPDRGSHARPKQSLRIFYQMRVAPAASPGSPVYPVGEGAARSPRCSRRQPCRAYPGGFNPDPHGSTFQAEPLAAALNTGYCLLPSDGG